MAKKEAKYKQTDYTIGGRDISNTAIPLYQEGLKQLGDYNRNVKNRIDPYIENYINLQNASAKSDMLREYQQTMGDLTGSNYAATGGGYSSLNQSNYDQNQRYYNDLASRMYANNLGAAQSMANEEYQMLYNALGAYDTAYAKGKDYSYYDQYNDLVDQQNSSAWAKTMSGIGEGIRNISMSSGNPLVMAIGGTLGQGMKMVGDANYVDTSAARANLGHSYYGGSGVSEGAYSSGLNKETTAGIASLFNNYDWFKNNPFGKK